MRVALLAALAFAFAFASASPVEADHGKTTHAKKKTKKSKKKKKHKKTVQESMIPGKHEKLATNMPKGWSWPPTKAMIAEGEACEKKLDELGIKWEKAEAEGRITTPITIPGMELGGLKLVSVYRKPPWTMDCHLALGLATYGPQLVAIGIRELHFSSIYRNTKVRVNGQTKNMLSRHALGLAIDVRSFVDEAGREAVVETDYNAADPMLLSIEQTVNDSGGFRTVLTPRNDPVSHYDHFHLEIAVEYPTEQKKPDI